MTHSFANVLYLFISMLGNCSCFYFRLLAFFKIKLLKINHQGPPSGIKQFVSRSRPTFCWSSSGFKLFAKGYWQTTKLSTGMQIVITGKYFSVQYIISYRDIHAYVYHKYSDTLNILSVNEKLPVWKFPYFGKYIIQHFGYCYVHVSSQRQAGLER